MRRHLFLPVLILIAASLACNAVFPPRPEVLWDTSPDAVIVAADTCCGMMYDPNGVTDLRLWGDGRVIWVEYDSHGGRRVLTATLTPDDMSQKLKAIVDSGFFGWKDYYEPPYQIYDAPSTCVNVYLASTSKSVCTLMGDPPNAFYGLSSQVIEGQSGSLYLPETGFLQATPMSGVSVNTPILQWPRDSLGMSLRDAAVGQWIEGEALELAWQIVNDQPFNAIVQEGDTYYNLVLLIPDITRQQPPVP